MWTSVENATDTRNGRVGGVREPAQAPKAPSSSRTSPARLRCLNQTYPASSTNSIRAIGAPSPLRGPSFRIRV
jgi:hypothetical protein